MFTPRAMEFCHSFGDGVSLATIETRKENDQLKTWLLKHGKYLNFGSGY